MIHIDIKPLSVNKAYQGRRFATANLLKYKEDVSLLLPHMDIPSGNLSVRYTFGVSRATDGDNLVKAFQDCLGECYGFNDNRIYEWHIKKVAVPKGKEYIEFEISTTES